MGEEGTHVKRRRHTPEQVTRKGMSLMRGLVLVADALDPLDSMIKSNAAQTTR